MSDVLLLIAQGAASDPAIGDLDREFDRQRLAGMTAFAENLMAKGGIAADLAVEDVRDALWVGNSPQVYDLLVRRRGWPLDRYEAWLARTWRRTLLA